VNTSCALKDMYVTDSFSLCIRYVLNDSNSFGKKVNVKFIKKFNKVLARISKTVIYKKYVF